MNIISLLLQEISIILIHGKECCTISRFIMRGFCIYVSGLVNKVVHPVWIKGVTVHHKMLTVRRKSLNFTGAYFFIPSIRKLFLVNMTRLNTFR